ncbi:hypothetical protein [Brevundimonas sp.]|uniref:hypothetical protein n=1 Tax=Brevundimonas sp. TaxID=1871086 RepID=UPI0035613BFE
MSEDPTPAEALEAIARSRRAVHDRVATGGWRYDLTYAAIMAGMVGGQAFDIPFNVFASTFGVLALAVIFQHESRRTGLRITGVSPRRARWVAIAMGLVFAAVMLGIVYLRRTASDVPVALIVAVAAGIAFVLALVGSRVWRRVYRAEMGTGE